MYTKIKKYSREFPLHIMLIPSIIVLIIYNYTPMFGIVMAFQRYVPARGILGSKWIGMDNFIYVLNTPNIFQVLFNTVYIAVMKIAAGLVIPILVALLLNELQIKAIKRGIQTLIYLPHFLSWVILSGILIDILSPSSGIVNQWLGAFGIEPIFFLGDKTWFPYMLVISETWKEFGFGTIIYLASLTAIDPTLYEAAIVDGANRWKQTRHITFPGIKGIVVLMSALSLGNVLNAGFDQVFNLYSPQVYRTGDILDTLIYRMGIINVQYGVATAVGLFKSVVSTIFIVTSYGLAYKFADYRIF